MARRKFAIMPVVERSFAMLHVQLDPETEKDLAFWAKRKDRTMDDIALEAIREKIEELEDIALLEDALKTYDPSENISMADVRRELGLGD